MSIEPSGVVYAVKSKVQPILNPDLKVQDPPTENNTDGNGNGDQSDLTNEPVQDAVEVQSKILSAAMTALSASKSFEENPNKKISEEEEVELGEKLLQEEEEKESSSYNLNSSYDSMEMDDEDDDYEDKLPVLVPATSKRTIETRPRNAKLLSKYTCSECPKSFPNQVTLEAHVANHSDDVHSCTFCEKTFRWKQSLRNHEKAHDAGFEKFMCSKCGKLFILRSSWYTHSKTCSASGKKKSHGESHKSDAIKNVVEPAEPAKAKASPSSGRQSSVTPKAQIDQSGLPIKKRGRPAKVTMPALLVPAILENVKELENELKLSKKPVTEVKSPKKQTITKNPDVHSLNGSENLEENSLTNGMADVVIKTERISPIPETESPGGSTPGRTQRKRNPPKWTENMVMDYEISYVATVTKSNRSSVSRKSSVESVTATPPPPTLESTKPIEIFQKRPEKSPVVEIMKLKQTTKPLPSLVPANLEVVRENVPAKVVAATIKSNCITKPTLEPIPPNGQPTKSHKKKSPQKNSPKKSVTPKQNGPTTTLPPAESPMTLGKRKRLEDAVIAEKSPAATFVKNNTNITKPDVDPIPSPSNLHQPSVTSNKQKTDEKEKSVVTPKEICPPIEPPAKRKRLVDDSNAEKSPAIAAVVKNDSIITKTTVDSVVASNGQPSIANNKPKIVDKEKSSTLKQNGPIIATKQPELPATKRNRQSVKEDIELQKKVAPPQIDLEKSITEPERTSSTPNSKLGETTTRTSIDATKVAAPVTTSNGLTTTTDKEGIHFQGMPKLSNQSQIPIPEFGPCEDEESDASTDSEEDKSAYANLNIKHSPSSRRHSTELYIKDDAIRFLANKISNRNMLRIRQELLTLKQSGNYFKLTKTAPLAAGLVHDMFCQIIDSPPGVPGDFQ